MFFPPLTSLSVEAEMTHASLQYLTPVLPCVLSPVVLLSVFPPLFPSCALSLCLQEEGVVSFCKVCALGLVNGPSHHLPNDMSKHAPPHPTPSPPSLHPTRAPRHPSRSRASHPIPSPSSKNPSSSMCHRAYGIWITHHASGWAAAHHCWHSGDSGSTHSVSFLFLATSNRAVFFYFLIYFFKGLSFFSQMKSQRWGFARSPPLVSISIVSPGCSSKMLHTGFSGWV